MHPASSVILFTSASGAGYGVLALVPVFAMLGLLPSDRWLGVTLLIPALGMVTIGLLASTFHLGHPERAWRALSQWRSSWLSREGIIAIVSYGPALTYSYGWIIHESTDGLWAWAGFATSLTAIGTLFTSAMIYRSLKPIPAWATDWTIAGYLILGPLSGLAVIAAVASGFGLHPVRFQGAAIALILAGAIIKNSYWARLHTPWNDAQAKSGKAVASGDVSVRSVEWPHTEENFVLKEMGFRVARNHTERLRRIARNLLFVIPALVFVVLPSIAPMPYVAWAIWLASILLLGGIVIERWLFFAEAKHVVTLYYGLDD